MSEMLVLNASRAVLDQLRGMLEGLDGDAYIAPGVCGATIGAHARHAIDHYAKLIDAYTAARTVDYDRRERGGSVETDRDAALAEIARIGDVLAALDAVQVQSPVRIRAMVDGTGSEAEMESTVMRELWFAAHHAIHHQALMKPIAEHHGVALPEGFGRAPSTVNHEAATG